jgi:integrase
MTSNPSKKSQKSEGLKRARNVTQVKATADRPKQRQNAVKRDSGVFLSATEHLIANAKSAATRRAYACDVAHFLANGGEIPCEPEIVMEYLTRFAQEKSVQTLSRRLIAIGQAHQEISAPSPVTDIRVKNLMQGIRRTHGKRKEQKRAVVKSDLLEALAMTDKRKPLQAARDKAILMTGFCGAFRRSELVALKVEDLRFEAGGVEIFIGRSKTDQLNDGNIKFIPYANGQRCAVLALKHWLEAAGISDGFVFRAVNRHDQVSENGLSAQSVSLIVKESIRRIGADTEAFAAHSLRSGYITSAAEAGHPLWSIKLVSLHKSDSQVSTYIRPVTKRKVPSLL